MSKVWKKVAWKKVNRSWRHFSSRLSSSFRRLVTCKGSSKAKPFSLSTPCAICLSTMNSEREANTIFTTPCSHSFHLRCIKECILHGNHGCPLCRSPLSLDPFQDRPLSDDDDDDDDDDEPLPAPPSPPPPPDATIAVHTLPEFLAIAAAASPSSFTVLINARARRAYEESGRAYIAERMANRRAYEESGRADMMSPQSQQRAALRGHTAMPASAPTAVTFQTQTMVETRNGGEVTRVEPSGGLNPAQRWPRWGQK